MDRMVITDFFDSVVFAVDGVTSRAASQLFVSQLFVSQLLA